MNAVSMSYGWWREEAFLGTLTERWILWVACEAIQMGLRWDLELQYSLNRKQKRGVYQNETDTNNSDGHNVYGFFWKSCQWSSNKNYFQ